MNIRYLALSILFIYMFNHALTLKAQAISNEEYIDDAAVEDDEDRYESEGEYHCFYVDTPTLNLRKSPSTDAPIVTKLSKYDVIGGFFDSDNLNREWINIAYYNPIEEKECNGYVNLKYLKELTTHDFFPKSNLNKQWTLLSQEWDYSLLTFEPEGDDSYTANIQVGSMGEHKINYMLIEDVSCRYMDGRIYENELPFYYNEQSGILLFYNLLWKEWDD